MNHEPQIYVHAGVLPKQSTIISFCFKIITIIVMQFRF